MEAIGKSIEMRSLKDQGHEASASQVSGLFDSAPDKFSSYGPDTQLLMRAVLRTIREEGLASQGESEGLGESNQGGAEQERMRGGGHRPGAKVAQQLQTETLPNPKGAATHERSGEKGASTSTPEHRP